MFGVTYNLYIFFIYHLRRIVQIVLLLVYKFVPFYMLDDLYEACTSEKKKVVIKGASHAHAEDENPEKYWKEVDGFINKYM